MSIALESNTSDRIDRSGFVHGMSCVSIYDSPESSRPVSGMFAGDLRFSAGNMVRNSVQELEEELNSCSSSSIGRNSDASGGSSDGADGSGESEVQSSYKGPLDTMDALEDVLPVKRGISKFYCGKSKSFTSLADTSSCSSIKDIAKPENAYTRKRKNELACNNTFWDKNRNFSLRSNSGVISKRPANCSRSILALAVTMSGSESNNNSENPNSNSSSSPPTLCLPPLHPQSRRLPNNESLSSPPQRNFSTWRSFSLSDLQYAATATPSITGSVAGNRDENDKLH